MIEVHQLPKIKRFAGSPKFGSKRMKRNAHQQRFPKNQFCNEIWPPSRTKLIGILPRKLLLLAFFQRIRIAANDFHGGRTKKRDIGGSH